MTIRRVPRDASLPEPAPTQLGQPRFYPPTPHARARTRPHHPPHPQAVTHAHPPRDNGASRLGGRSRSLVPSPSCVCVHRHGAQVHSSQHAGAHQHDAHGHDASEPQGSTTGAGAVSGSIDTLRVPTISRAERPVAVPVGPLLVRRAQPGSLLDGRSPASTTSPSSGHNPLEQVEWV